MDSGGTYTTYHTTADKALTESGPFKIMSKDVDKAYSKLLEFAIELPEQITYWNQISVWRLGTFYSSEDINEKIRIINSYYNTTLSILGHLYQLKRNNLKSSQKMINLLNSFFRESDRSMKSLESMTLLEKLDQLPKIIQKVQKKYFKPSYLKRNWISLLLISTIGSWAFVKVYKSRNVIYLALKEFKSTGSQLIKVWIWEPIIRIYETIRYKDSKLKVMGAESLSSDLDSLERMVLSFAKDSGVSNPQDLKMIGNRALEGDLKFVLESYEEDLRHPIYSISTGALIRPLLIQIQKAKVDAALALSALDTLLRSNELNFAFLAVLPLVGVLGIGASWMRGRWIYWSGAGKTSLKLLMQKSLRSIEKEFNRNHHSSNHMHPESYGHILVDLSLLKRTAAKFFHPINFKEFLSDLEQLEECFTDKWTVGQGLETFQGESARVFIMLQAIRYSLGSLEILNQLLLPFESVYEELKSTADAHAAIKTMKVRGAPAIALVAVLSLAVELHVEAHHRSVSPFKNASQVALYIHEKLEYLKTSRPTAVNLFEAADRLDKLVQKAASTFADPIHVLSVYIEAAEAMMDKDLKDNQSIGSFGADFILSYAKSQNVCILTHCNTGSLATSGWGTALGIIRELNSRKQLTRAFCTETRPYNQGSRLTAFELVYESIPSTLICDSMVSALLKDQKIDAIVVGADRVAANGDTANKIGTYQMAISAKYHNIPFIVAAPCTSIDLSIKSGQEIKIEQRPGIEVTQVRGLEVQDEANLKEPFFNPKTTNVLTAAEGIDIWNPAFDVTPYELISAIVTEKGVFTPGDDGKFKLLWD